MFLRNFVELIISTLKTGLIINAVHAFYKIFMKGFKKDILPEGGRWRRVFSKSHATKSIWK